MNRAAIAGRWRTETRVSTFRAGDASCLSSASTAARAEGASAAGQSAEGASAESQSGAMGALWLSAVREALPPGGGHLDLGCGEGRMTFALADRWAPGGWSIGADRDGEALGRARARAERENLPGARFAALDVEKEDYAPLLAGRHPDLITAHLCMGAEIVRRSAAVLPPGGVFACVALHTGLWAEFGCTSRFALSTAELETMLAECGLVPEFRRVETEVLEIGDPREFTEIYFRGGESVPRWKKDGRWEALEDYFAGGGRSLTVRAQLQCVARRAGRSAA